MGGSWLIGCWTGFPRLAEKLADSLLLRVLRKHLLQLVTHFEGRETHSGGSGPMERLGAGKSLKASPDARSAEMV